MKTPTIIVIATLLTACGGGASDQEELAVSFWTAVQDNDVPALKSLVAKPESADMFAKDSGFSLVTDSFSVQNTTDKGVDVTLSRDCYPDRTVSTHIVEVQGQLKADVQSTLHALISQSADYKPIRKYCYELADQELQGVINGQPWSVAYVDRQTFDFGTKKFVRIALLPQKCPESGCFALNVPSITIDNPNLDGDGGNFSGSENIIIFTPPGDNRIVSDGSYRLSTAVDGKRKLEITFKLDDENYLSGFVTV